MITKICTRCAVEKDLSAFSRDKSRVDGHTHRCKPCDSVKASSWQKVNVPQKLESARSWRAKNPETVRASRQASQARARISRALRDRRYRALMAQGMSTLDREVSRCYRFALLGRPCRYCGLVKIRMENDHFFPVHKGGTDHWWNLVRACHGCNRRKSAHCGTWAILAANEAWEQDLSDTRSRIGRPRKRN